MFAGEPSQRKEMVSTRVVIGSLFCICCVVAQTGPTGPTVPEGNDAGISLPSIAMIAETGLAAVNVEAFALLAAASVVQAGTKAFMKIKEVAAWEKKENDAVCALSVQTYQQTSETLRIIKLTAMVGQTAVENEKLEKDGAGTTLGALITNTKNMCDLVVVQRAEAYAAAQEACKDKPTIRGAFMLADLELGPMHCSELFKDVRLAQMVKESKQPWWKKDKLDAIDIEQETGFSSSYDMMFEAAKQGAFDGDVTNANVLEMYETRFVKDTIGFTDEDISKLSIIIPFAGDKVDVEFKKLVGTNVAKFMQKIVPRMKTKDGKDASDFPAALKSFMDSHGTDVADFSVAVDKYGGEVLDSYVTNNLEKQILQPFLKATLASKTTELSNGLAIILPETLSAVTTKFLGGVPGLVAGEIGKVLKKIIGSKLDAFSANLLKTWLGDMREKNAETYRDIMCRYYRKEADNDIKVETFLSFVFRFINVNQASGKSKSPLAERMRLPRQSCEILFQGESKDGVSLEDARAKCDNYKMREMIWKLVERYSDGNSFDNSKCNQEMCLANFKSEDSVPACTVLCNHASAVSTMEFPDDHWFDESATSIADSLTKFVRLAAKKRETNFDEIFKGVQEHCKAKGMQMIYALQRSVDKGVNHNAELAKVVGMKPSGGQCVPDMYFVAQGLVKAVANVVTSDYANLDIPKDQYRYTTAKMESLQPRGDKINIMELKTAREILDAVQRRFNDNLHKKSVDVAKKGKTIKDQDCVWNYNKFRCEPENACGYKYQFKDLTFSKSCRTYKTIQIIEDEKRGVKGVRKIGHTGIQSSEEGYHNPDLKEEQDKIKDRMKDRMDDAVRPDSDEGCSWDYSRHQCEPARFCERRYKFKDFWLSTSCRLKPVSPPIQFCNEKQMEGRQLQEGFQNCISEQYAREVVKPAMSSFCNKIPASMARADGLGSVKEMCLDAVAFLTEKQNLLGDGVESLERMVVSETGIYGYEIMFAHYAFETIPGAKSNMKTSAGERGNLNRLSSLDDIPEFALGKTLSDIAIRSAINAVVRIIRMEVITLIANWDKVKGEGRYKSIETIMGDQQTRVDVLKTINGVDGVPVDAFWDSNVGEKPAESVKKIIIAAMEVIPLRRIAMKMADAWGNGQSKDPLQNPLNSIGLDCTYNDIRYIRQLTDAAVSFRTQDSDDTKTPVLKRFVAALAMSVSGKIERPKVLPSQAAKQDDVDEDEFLETNEKQCDMSRCSEIKFTRKETKKLRLRIRKCLGTDRCCMLLENKEGCTKFDCVTFKKSRFYSLLNNGEQNRIDDRCKDKGGDEDDENDDIDEPTPVVPKVDPTNLPTIDDLSQDGQIFSPYAALLSGSKNWIRWRSTPGFGYLKEVFTRDNYPGRYMPEEVFYQPGFLKAKCGGEAESGPLWYSPKTEKKKVITSSDTLMANDNDEFLERSSRRLGKGSMRKKMKEGECCNLLTSCKGCEYGSEPAACRYLRSCKFRKADAKESKSEEVPKTSSPDEAPKSPIPDDEPAEEKDLFKEKKVTDIKPAPVQNQDCRWNYMKFRCEPEADCSRQYKFGDMTLSHSCRAKVKDTSVDKDWYSKMDMSKIDENGVGKCCYWGSTCNSCPYGNEYTTPYHCPWTSRKCKNDPKKPKISSEEVTDQECRWDFFKMHCVGPNRQDGVCSHQFRWGDMTLGQSCRAIDRGIVHFDGEHKIFDASKAPELDEQCTWSYTTDRCEPHNFCSRQYKLWDMTLSQSCRKIDQHHLADALAKARKKYDPYTVKDTQLINCGVRSVLEGKYSGGIDTYSICTSGKWELDAGGSSNSPMKICQAKGFGWSTSLLKNQDITFSVPLSFRKSEYVQNAYHFVSLTRPQQSALEVELSTGGLPINDRANLEKAICEVCQLQFTMKKIDFWKSLKGRSDEMGNAVDCKISCQTHMPHNIDRCMQKCELFINKNNGAWRDVRNHGINDIRDALCASGAKIFSKQTIAKFKATNPHFLQCSTGRKTWKQSLGSLLKGGAEIQYSGKQRWLGDLLSEYAAAVAFQVERFQGKGVTSDPCDTNHLGYCPISFTPTKNMWARDRKPIYDKLKKERDDKSVVKSAAERKLEEEEEARNNAGVNNQECAFKCMKKGNRAVDPERGCDSLHELMLDCVKCGDPECTKKAKTRCVKEGARVKEAGGTDCPVSKIKWLGVANQLEFESVPDSLEYPESN